VEHDYYRTLGVTPEASSEDIKKSYRNLARKYHPDRNPGDQEGEERLKVINEAYQVLGDEEKRRRYDFFHSRGLNGNALHKGGVENEFVNVFWTLFKHGVDIPMRGACKGMGLGRGGCRRKVWNFKGNR
jgi:DnaJ-class molecular chaperone